MTEVEDLPPTTADVFLLHLAGIPAEEIAEKYGLPLPAVTNAITLEAQDRHPDTPQDLAVEIERCDRLWRPLYAKAVQGEQEPAALAMRLMHYRQQLTARAQTLRPRPVEPEPVVPPPQAIRTAWQILAGNAPHVAQSLVDVARYSQNDGARVAASVAVLDRVGIGRVERSEVAVHLLDHSARELDPQNADPGAPTSAAAIVRQRLQAIAQRSAPQPDDPDVIDAAE